MHFYLRDIDTRLVSEWQASFAGCHDVEVSSGDIFEAEAQAIVSPANSFGFMDGGIDLVYSRRFGWELQERLQALLRGEHAGELPVGQAVIVPTQDPSIPFLISAPTMRVPMNVADTLNAYLAFRAVILCVQRHNRQSEEKIDSILCPGLGTAVGKMPVRRCAAQMYAAYATSHLGQVFEPRSLGEAQDDHYRMLV